MSGAIPLLLPTRLRGVDRKDFTFYIFKHRLYSDSLRAGRSGDRVPVVGRSSANVQTGPEPLPAFCPMVPGLLSGGEAAEA